MTTFTDLFNRGTVKQSVVSVNVRLSVCPFALYLLNRLELKVKVIGQDRELLLSIDYVSTLNCHIISCAMRAAFGGRPCTRGRVIAVGLTSILDR